MVHPLREVRQLMDDTSAAILAHRAKLSSLSEHPLTHMASIARPVLPSLGGALPLRHAFFLDEIVRPVLGLREHAAKIFANNAQAQQLDASEQQDPTTMVDA